VEIQVSFGRVGERIDSQVVKDFLELLGSEPVEPLGLSGGDKRGAQILARAASLSPSLASELMRLRSLLDRVYDLVDDPPGTEELQAELEREVQAIRAERGA
jgi:hypothetical protein